MICLDTSALLPYYREEPGSGAIQALMSAQRHPVTLSVLTRVEFASALARWVRQRELTGRQARQVEDAFEEDLAVGRFSIRAIGDHQFDRAFRWLMSRRTSLRTLDSLHLASAESFGLPLVTLDRSLADAGRALGVRVEVPAP